MELTHVQEQLTCFLSSLFQALRSRSVQNLQENLLNASTMSLRSLATATRQPHRSLSARTSRYAAQANTRRFLRRWETLTVSRISVLDAIQSVPHRLVLQTWVHVTSLSPSTTTSTRLQPAVQMPSHSTYARRAVRRERATLSQARS